MALYGYDKKKNMGLCSHSVGCYGLNAGSNQLELRVSDFEIGDSAFFYNTSELIDDSYANVYCQFHLINDVNAYTAFSVNVFTRIWKEQSNSVYFDRTDYTYNFKEDYSYQLDTSTFNTEVDIKLLSRVYNAGSQFSQYANWIFTRVM